ncbi:LOW QUALITY PROTEIN: hypothetical protein CFC21_055005, partial [Triticum aestivum]
GPVGGVRQQDERCGELRRGPRRPVARRGVALQQRRGAAVPGAARARALPPRHDATLPRAPLQAPPHLVRLRAQERSALGVPGVLESSPEMLLHVDDLPQPLCLLIHGHAIPQRAAQIGGRRRVHGEGFPPSRRRRHRPGPRKVPRGEATQLLLQERERGQRRPDRPVAGQVPVAGASPGALLEAVRPHAAAGTAAQHLPHVRREPARGVDGAGPFGQRGGRVACGYSRTASPSAYASVSLGRSKLNGGATSSGLVLRVDAPLHGFGRPWFSIQMNSGFEF